jgi:Flp pilus assembly secretin CpaC
LSLLVASGPSFRASAPNISVVQAAGVSASGSSTVTPINGSGSYSYAWTASIAGVTFGGTTTPTLTATRTSTTVGSSSGTASVVVTDLVSGATASCAISVYLENA